MSSSDGLSPADAYFFDLNGYLVVRGVLDADEVARANAAIDRHRSQASERVVRPSEYSPFAHAYVRPILVRYTPYV